MSEPTLNELYDHVVAQIDREDDLYQKRVNFLIILNAGLAAGAGSQLHYGPRLVLALAISVFAIVLTLTLNSGLYDGKRQLHYLRTFYYDKLERHGFLRPFMSGPDGGTRSIPPRRFGRIIREFLIGWSIFLVLCVAFLFHYSLVGSFDVRL